MELAIALLALNYLQVFNLFLLGIVIILNQFFGFKVCSREENTVAPVVVEEQLK